MNQNRTQLPFTTVVTERHAVRHYQKNHTIPPEDLQEIMRLAQTAPSAWNLQHWRVMVIQDPAYKGLILPIAYQQQQVMEASAVFIILGDLEANRTAELAYEPLVDKGMMPETAYKELLHDINQAYETQNENTRDAAVLNAALFAMQLMLAAKSKGYDTGPMSGFDKDQIVKALKIPHRFIPVMMITAGIASKPAHPTTRLPVEDFLIYESF